MNELQAAMGLAVLSYVDDLIQTRKKQVELYNKILDFENFKKIIIRENTDWNYRYYPVIFKSESRLLRVQRALNEEKIFPRRYFYPSLNTLDYVKFEEMEISQDISKSILCLPLYAELRNDEIGCISKIINKTLSL